MRQVKAPGFRSNLLIPSAQFLLRFFVKPADAKPLLRLCTQKPFVYIRELFTACNRKGDGSGIGARNPLQRSDLFFSRFHPVKITAFPGVNSMERIHDKPGFPLRQTHRAPSNKAARRPSPYKRMRPQRLPSGKDYPRWTKGNTPASGQKGRWRRSQVWWASAHLHPAALPAPHFSSLAGPSEFFGSKRGSSVGRPPVPEPW